MDTFHEDYDSNNLLIRYLETATLQEKRSRKRALFILRKFKRFAMKEGCFDEEKYNEIKSWIQKDYY